MRRVLSCAPVAYAALWAAQTVSIKLYVSSHQLHPLRVLAAVAAAELTKLAAAGLVVGAHTRPMEPRMLVCAMCAVACAALAYPVLARLGVTQYVPLLGCQHLLRLVFVVAAKGSEAATPHALAAAALGVGAFVTAALHADRWAAVAAFVQSFLTCFAEALDDVGEARGDLFGATACTAWTAATLALGAALADVRQAALVMVSPTQPYALAAIALMATSSLMRSAAALEVPWPATAAAVEAALLLAAGARVLREPPGMRVVVANACAVIAASVA